GLNAGEAARPHARDPRLAFDPAARSLVPWRTPGPRPAALFPTAGTIHRFAFPIALDLLLSSSARAAAQSLRGPKAWHARQVRQAELHDYTFLRRPADVERFVRAGLLVPVRGNADYELAQVSFPYARPEVRIFI